MRFGTDEKDDFDLASISSSDLRLCAMHMCSTPRSPSTASPARARSWQPELTRRALLARPDAALYLCKHPGHVSLVRLLHEHNASLDHPAVTSKGKPVLAPLHAAAAQYHTNVVRYMLDNGVEIKQPREGFHPYDTMTKNFAGSAGGTALWVASVSGHESTVQFLLTRGARVDSTDDAGKTPLHAACAAGHDEVARLLSDNGASFDLIARRRHTVDDCLRSGPHRVCARAAQSRCRPLQGRPRPRHTPRPTGIAHERCRGVYLYAFHNGHRER